MAADTPGGTATPTVLRIKLRYEDVDTFVERFAGNVTRGGVFLASRQPRAIGTPLRFELLLADGARAWRGEGVVAQVVPVEAEAQGKVPGMGVRLTRLDAEGVKLHERLLARRASGPRPPAGASPSPTAVAPTVAPPTVAPPTVAPPAATPTAATPTEAMPALAATPAPMPARPGPAATPATAVTPGPGPASPAAPASDPATGHGAPDPVPSVDDVLERARRIARAVLARAGTDDELLRLLDGSPPADVGAPAAKRA